MSRYTPPKLDGHKVAFKGKRWWIIEVDKEHPFDGHPYDDEIFVVYDKREHWILAIVYIDEDGFYDCVHCAGQQDLHVKVQRMQDIGRIIEKYALEVCKTMG